MTYLTAARRKDDTSLRRAYLQTPEACQNSYASFSILLTLLCLRGLKQAVIRDSYLHFFKVSLVEGELSPKM